MIDYIKSYSNYEALNEKRAKDERKLKRAERKTRKIDKLKARKKKSDEKGKEKKSKRITHRIDKKRHRIEKLANRFNNRNIEKRLKIKACKKVKSDIKTIINGLKNQDENKNSKKISNYEHDYNIIDLLIKEIRKNSNDNKIIERFLKQLKQEDVLKKVEEEFKKAEDESNISDEEISQATHGEVTSLSSNKLGIKPDELWNEIKQHYLEVKNTFKYKITKYRAPLLNTSLADESLNIVKFIQYMLNKLELDSGPEDGNFSKKTKTALLKFQEKNNLPTTGEVDIDTWKKILTLMKVEFDKNNFNIYHPKNGMSNPSPESDLLARLKKWLQL